MAAWSSPAAWAAAFELPEAAFAGALERLLTDPDLGRRLANNGLRTYEANYTLDVMVDRTIDLYRELLDLRAHCERHP